MNNIDLATIYLPILDEIYKNEAKTSILEGDEATIRLDDHGSVQVAKIEMSGLGDFSRSTGYTTGDVSLTWETIAWDKERSQDLRIDRLDNSESLDVAAARLMGEFMRTKVIPETDAARIAKIASTTGIGSKNELLDDGEKVIKALRAATNAFDEAEVDLEQRILFITPTNRGMIEDLETVKSREVLSRFAEIIEVPQTRMYSKITLNSGASNYGYTVAEGGKPLNFLAVQRRAAVAKLNQYIKYFTPDEDQNGDSHVFKYRNNNLYAHVFDNKVNGVYASIAAQA